MFKFWGVALLLSFGFFAMAKDNSSNEKELVNLKLHHVATAVGAAKTADQLISLLNVKLPPGDAEYFRNIFAPLEKEDRVLVKGSILTLQHGEATSQFEVVDAKTRTYKIDGKKIIFTSKKSLRENLKALLPEKTALEKLENLLIPRAHAEPVTLATVGAIAFAAAMADLVISAPCTSERQNEIADKSGFKLATLDSWLSCIATPLTWVGATSRYRDLKAVDIQCPQDASSKYLEVTLVAPHGSYVEKRRFYVENGRLTKMETKSEDLRERGQNSLFSIDYESNGVLKQLVDHRGSNDINVRAVLATPEQKAVAASVAGDFAYYNEVCQNETRLIEMRWAFNQRKMDERKATDIVPPSERSSK